jgi:nucleoside-diphosphate-sugar epimerase
MLVLIRGVNGHEIANGKKLLITGVCGFIGGNLLKKLMDKNEVIGLDNFEYSNRDLCKDLVRDIVFIEGDVFKSETFEKVPKDVDFILHVGAASSIILFNRNMHHC